MMLQINEVSKYHNEQLVLNSVSFTQAEGEKIGIVGETGSGKSTLVKIIAGIEQASDGTVFFNNKRVIGPLEQLLPGHPCIAYLSQHFDLRNNYVIEDLLRFRPLVSDDMMENIFQICKINHLLKRKTHQVSGGEKQRIATAQLLLQAPTLFIIDEPFTNLDFAHKQLMKQVIADIGNQLNITCTMVSHEATDILPWAEKIIVLQQGNIIQIGTPKNIYHNPLNTYVASLLGNYSLLNNATIQLLTGTPIQAENDKLYFARPEDIQLEKSIFRHNAYVKEINFMGHYYLINVQLINGANVLVLSRYGDFTLGETVLVTLPKMPKHCIN